MHETPQAQSVSEFCKANGISMSFFYKLQRQNQGPRLMKIGRRTLITTEAAHDWRERMTVPEKGGE